MGSLHSVVVIEADLPARKIAVHTSGIRDRALRLPFTFSVCTCFVLFETVPPQTWREGTKVITANRNADVHKKQWAQ